MLEADRSAGGAVAPFARILASARGADALGLRRIGEQVEKNVVVDRDAIDRPPFVTEGGFRRLNKVFDGALENVLGEINEELWKGAA